MRAWWPPAASTRVSPGFSSKAPDAAVPSGVRVRDWAIAAGGLLLAFWLGFTYAANNSLQFDWAQTRFAAAVNYACTGRFGAVRLTPEATAADHAALDTLTAFLEVRRLDFPCASFPQNVAPARFVDGVDVANAEQPLYLMLVYGLAWRSAGVHWGVTHYVVATIAAVSFVVLYLCLRPFVPTVVATAVALLFLISPFFITNALSPRDALKFPFALGIAALLIGRGTAPRRPVRFVAFTALIGLLIGIGYGFRSDILFLLVPAMLISAAVAAIELPAARAPARKTSTVRKLGLRFAAVAALLAAFVAGAALPLVNDHVLNDNHGDVGYGPLAMGLLGHTRHDLYQGHSLVEGMYMFRSSYNNDLSVGVRVMEFAARRSGEQIEHGAGRYWTYAKRYYLQVASFIPADLVAGGIGAFVNLMTVPRSLFERNSQAWRYDRAAPWRMAYAFVADSSPYASVLRGVDAVYRAAVAPSADAWFVANVVVLFLFLWLIAWRFGARAAVAAVLLLAAALMVTSLKFEHRHVFYILAWTVVAWTAVLWGMLRLPWSASRMLRDRSAAGDAAASGNLRQAVGSAVSVAMILSVAAAGVGATLIVTRAHQTKALHALAADWSARERTPAQFEVAESAPGRSLIRILSPMPLSTGGARARDDAVKPVVEMGLVAVTFDADRCADRRIVVTGLGDSDVRLPETTYLMHEAFSVTLAGGGDYVALLPAFNYHQPRQHKMIYSGVELASRDVPCVKGVSTITEFKPHDVLFDFFVPADPAKLRRDDLFQRVYVPGLGFI